VEGIPLPSKKVFEGRGIPSTTQTKNAKKKKGF